MSRSAPESLPRRIHLVGIGGIGLSAIARGLASRGHIVSGSDLRGSDITRGLDSLGIETYVGHRAEQVAGAELVIVSSAIPEGNVEVQAALSAGIPVVKRRQLLGRMMAGSYGIAVAGTHGKTTTASMISVILERLARSPTFIVGGVIAELGTNARGGSGPHFVIEADEYDRTFYGLQPQVAVVTNIEMDHPDCYADMAEMRFAYRTFLELVPAAGCIVACADSPELVRVLDQHDEWAPRVVTYGALAQADYVVTDARANSEGGVDFRLVREGARWGTFSLIVPGLHNALNAAAALAVAELVGIGLDEAGQVLSGFRGVLRRFEVKGESDGIVVVDDYAHHPTQVRATLAAARLRYPERRLWAVFQPHTFSRTQALFGQLASCFGDADQVIITDIYAARSHERPTISAADLVAACRHPRVRHIGSIDAVVGYLARHLCPGDVLLTLGAGDSYLISERVLAQLEGRGKA